MVGTLHKHQLEVEFWSLIGLYNVRILEISKMMSSDFGFFFLMMDGWMDEWMDDPSATQFVTQP